MIFDDFSRGTRANLATAAADARVQIVEGDIRDRDAVARVLEGADALIHMAALRITACAADPREAFDVMCTGSFNLVEAAQQAGVRKIVAASTASVYGLAESISDRRDASPLRQPDVVRRGQAHARGPAALVQRHVGLPYVALRYFNVYGPRMDIDGKATPKCSFAGWNGSIPASRR